MRHCTAVRAGTPLVVAFAAASLALLAPLAGAALASVTGRQCVDGGGVIFGNDPLPMAFCQGGKYDGQQVVG
ncbi:hypothetical protein [Actinomadura fibrosa]|uniref:Secreted protein n=1 Tax=Actinomadura fibrosa TaxID=111802 RepID=A0ABW2Y235_9ACTN|nr:hypothetical protein [Actinomadura fibrosa]